MVDNPKFRFKDSIQTGPFQTVVDQEDNAVDDVQAVLLKLRLERITLES